MDSCKTHFDLQDQRRIAPMGPSLLNILQAGTGVAREGIEPSFTSAGQPTRSRRVAGLNLNMIQNLRRRLNRVPSSSEFGAEVRQTSPGVSTPCKFLSGYQSLGRCTEVRSCRVGNIEYQNNVSALGVSGLIVSY